MSTINVTTIQHESGSGSNIVLDSDGNVGIDNNLTAGGDPTDGAADGVRVEGRGLLAASRASGFAVFAGHKTGEDAATSTITSDGSSSFKGALEVDRESGTNTGVIIRENGTAKTRLFADGSIVAAGRIMADTTSSGNGLPFYSLTNSTDKGSACVRMNNTSSGGYFMYGSKGNTETFHVDNDGNISGTTVFFALDRENPANYVSTTNADGETESVYNGPVLDVKDELQALRARATQQDAVIAQMVTALRSQGVTIDTTEVKE